jgi:hypothetical protein
MEPAVRRRLIALLVPLGIVALAIYFRWPRLSDDMVHYNVSPEADKSLDIEYRMRQPFSVVLDHTLEAVSKQPAESGIQLSSTERLRAEEVARIPSWYDILHGEYYVRLHLSQQNGELVLDGNGQTLAIPIWCGKPAIDFNWTVGGSGRRAAAVGTSIATLRASGEQESLWARATISDGSDRP